MSDPISFDNTSPRFSLPLLYAGQAQKEFHVNEAHALIDSLLHVAIEGEASNPPGTPGNGQSWLVGPSPTGDWAGQAGKVASWQGGNWLFTAPCDGMHILNRANGQNMRFFGSWRMPSAVAAPAGGATVDTEARVAIMQLLTALFVAGIFPAV